MDIQIKYVLLGGIFALQSALVCAADETNPFYFSGKFVAGLSELDDVQNSGAITGTVSSMEDDDAVGGFSAALGYQWQDFRFEIEYLWRYRMDFGAQFSGLPTTLGSDIQTNSIMVNGLWDYKNSTNFTPYIGVGLGWAGHEADTNRGDASVGAISLENTTDNFVWSFLLGTTYSINHHWAIDLGYRYSDLGDVEIGPFSDAGRVEMEYHSHDFTAGITYDF